jgi:hypothetical protein
MNPIQPGELPIVPPVSIGPAPGAHLVQYSPLGTPVYTVQQGYPGATPVDFIGGSPPSLEMFPDHRLPPGALLQHGANTGYRSVPVRSSDTYSSPTTYHYVSPTAAERDAARAAGGGRFWGGLLALPGAFVYCAPPWWIIASHNPTATAMTARGVLQALVGLWAITTFIVGPIALVCFLGAVASLFKPRPGR